MLTAEPELEFPDWEAPIDVAAAIASTPTDVTVKGMFFSMIERALLQKGLEINGRHAGFRDYPMVELMRFQVEACGRLYPHLSQREGLRRLGWSSYETFVQSAVGRIVFGNASRDPMDVAKLAAKGYRHAASEGDALLHVVADNHVLLHLTKVWNFPDAYQVGAVEGALAHLGYRGEVRVFNIATAEAVLDIRWWPLRD